MERLLVSGGAVSGRHVAVGAADVRDAAAICGEQMVELPSALAVTAAGCGSGSEAGGGKADEPVKLTMWVRAGADAFSQRLVDTYNKSHKNQVKLSVIPNENYLQMVGAAAGGNKLPDLLAADVVYSPNYVAEACTSTSRSSCKG